MQVNSVPLSDTCSNNVFTLVVLLNYGSRDVEPTLKNIDDTFNKYIYIFLVVHRKENSGVWL